MVEKVHLGINILAKISGWIYSFVDDYGEFCRWQDLGFFQSFAFKNSSMCQKKWRRIKFLAKDEALVDNRENQNNIFAFHNKWKFQIWRKNLRFKKEEVKKSKEIWNEFVDPPASPANPTQFVEPPDNPT